jgi:transposase-like protein
VLLGGAKLKMIRKIKNSFCFRFSIYICDHQNIMENIGKSFKIRCIQAGVSVKELCDRAGVTTATIRNWEKEEPHSIQLMRKLEAAMKEIESKRETAC